MWPEIPTCCEHIDCDIVGALTLSAMFSSGPTISMSLIILKSVNFCTDRCLPWWLNGKESTCNAGDMGSILEPGRFHMPQSNKVSAPQLVSLCSAAAAEARMPRARALQQEKPQLWEARALQLESSLCSLQLEQRPRSNEDPEQLKINK